MPTDKQMLAIGRELRDAVSLIKAGLGQLQHLDGANDFYHLPILTIANGFERLMKAILCLRILDTTGKFPWRNGLPRGRHGHDLIALLERVRKECFLDEYKGGPAVAKADWEYLQSDQLLSFLEILSDFGQSARYHHMDVVVGLNDGLESSADKWKELETEIVFTRPELLEDIKVNPASERIYGEVSAEVVARLEKMARALSRLFTIGRIGSVAKRYSPYLNCFLFIQDEELGKTKYNPIGALEN